VSTDPQPAVDPPHPRHQWPAIVQQYSEDRRWWWDGTRWLPVSAPARRLLTAGAFASLGLALASYVLLATHFAVLAPVTSILAIAAARAARHSLPATSKRDRRVAAIGMALAILPLALIILVIMVIQVVIGYSIVTGRHSFP
jgi:hypothetical protein